MLPRDLCFVLMFGVQGKVAENAKVSNAINPKWRTAQTHVSLTQTPSIVLLTRLQFIAGKSWPDSTTPDEVQAMKQTMTEDWVPIIANMTGETDSASYSNEADVREPDFQTTFFGENYARLKAIKAAYDPEDLFIVPAGVGSEDWDPSGICKLAD